MLFQSSRLSNALTALVRSYGVTKTCSCKFTFCATTTVVPQREWTLIAQLLELEALVSLSVL
jgi:hypothetical protein